MAQAPSFLERMRGSSDSSMVAFGIAPISGVWFMIDLVNVDVIRSWNGDMSNKKVQDSHCGEGIVIDW